MTRTTNALGAGLLAATIAALWYSGMGGSAAQTARAQRLTSNKEQIAGTWQLISIYEENVGGLTIDLFGTAPQGQFMADRQGNYSLQILGRDGGVYSGNTRPTVINTRVGGHLAATSYFGSYLVDEVGRRLTLRVAYCLFSNCDKTLRTAELKIGGNTMQLTSAVEPSPTGAPYSHTVWKRVCCE